MVHIPTNLCSRLMAFRTLVGFPFLIGEPAAYTSQVDDATPLPPVRAAIVNLLTSGDWHVQQGPHQAFLAIPDEERHRDMAVARSGRQLSRTHGKHPG